MRTITTTLLFLLMSLASFGQTTYTTTQDSCGGKTSMLCWLNAVDQNGNVVQITIDNRLPYRQGYLGITPSGGSTTWYHGGYSFPQPSSGTDPFYGVATYASDAGLVNGNFVVYAYYVKTCSGRGCGATLGWHYVVKMGSTVTVD